MSQTPKLQRAPKRNRLKSRRDADAVVTSMVLPRALHQRAAHAALDLNWSMAALIRAALTEWFARHGAELRRSRA